MDFFRFDCTLGLDGEHESMSPKFLSFLANQPAAEFELQ